ncbi:MAG: DUF1295 domain-containing protein [Rhizobiaceae bacterium]
MAFGWWLAVRTGKSGWVDATWTFAVGVCGVAVAFAPVGGWQQDATRTWLVAALAAIWSLRLGLHIVSRTLEGGDDPRYAQLRKQWGNSWRTRLFLFLQIQAACAIPLVVAIGAAGHNPAPDIRIADWIGVLILVTAIAGEGIADRQLRAFASKPANKGKVCDVGLWAWSRHPNYFFEWLGWLAYPVIAIELSWAYPWGWAALGAPAVMYWLLVHVSGIPPLEEHMLRSRGDAFRVYQARVNAFWPGPPRSV